MKATDLYVAHIGSSVMHVGTKEECEAYRAAQPYSTLSWKIQGLEEYGDSCYSEGFDNGFDSGIDQASW